METDFNPVVSVIIVTCGRKHDVKEAIQSIYQQTYGNVEIVVIDNASKDGSFEMIGDTFDDVVTIREASNTGPYAARNRGITSTRGEIVYFLDDDGTLEDDALEQVVRVMRKDRRIGVVVSRVIDSRTDEPEGIALGLMGNHGKQLTYLGDLVTEGAVAVRRCVFEDIGNWPARYFRQSVGRQMSLRILDAGYDILYCPKSIMYHKHSPLADMSRDRIEKDKCFYRVRNELWIAWTYLPFGRAILESLIKLAYYPFASLRTGALFHCLRGIAAAFRVLPRIITRERTPVKPETLTKRDYLLYLDPVHTRNELARISSLSSWSLITKRMERFVESMVG